MLLTASALALGFLHGLGADHLMAIAALSVGTPNERGEPSRTHPVRVAFGFALGHALLLLAGSALVLVLGWHIPVLVERAGELVGGTLLIGLGVFTLWVASAGRLYGHTHAHAHRPHPHPHVHGDDAHAHWHVHLGDPARHSSHGGHSHVPGVLGAVFAVSGLRALTLLAPFGGELPGGVAGSLALLLYAVTVFAAGILLSMSLFGIVLSRVLDSTIVARTIGRGASILTAVASIGLGLYWVLR